MATGTSGLSQATPQLQYDKSRFILRHIKFRNFIHFEDEQELEFERTGVYFLIGQNQSGKSSVLEAIRRCLSLRYSSSFSSRPKSEKESIIVTRYKNENGEVLLAFYMCMRKSKDSDIDVCLKGCAILEENNTTVKRLALDVVHFQSGNLISKQVSANKADFPSADQINLDSFQFWISQQYNESTCIQSDNEQGIKELNSECEQLLKQYLEGVVFAFSMRGVGPLQWSKSEKIENQSNNYQEANNRAEIIMWYLKRCDGMNGDGTTETRKEEEYYNSITNNRGGRYVLDSSKSEITVEKDGSKPWRKPWPILKQSEGFVEAKLCSILLSVEDFATVSIEDPGTGMHPQMIDRLCLIMSERVDDRVVIVPTHNANFLKPWLLDWMFYFKRTDNGLFKIASGKSLSENNDLKAAIPGSVTAEQFANFCYAETIVLVEGITDQLFFEGLSRIMRKSDTFYMPLSVCQFVSMGGGGKTKHFRKCCTILNKEFVFILDKDKKIPTLGKEGSKGTTGTLPRACWDDIWDEKDGESSEEKTEEPERYLNESRRPKDYRKTFIDENKPAWKKRYETERKLYFFWESGNLEDVFWNILFLLKYYEVELDKNVGTALRACLQNEKFENPVSLKTPKANVYVSNLESSETKPEKFKIFAHGEETYEQRLTVIEFLWGENFIKLIENKSAMTNPPEDAPVVERVDAAKRDIHEIRCFLRELCGVRDATTGSSCD